MRKRTHKKLILTIYLSKLYKFFIMQRPRRPREIIKPMANSCVYCDEDRTPSYKEHEIIAKYLTDRGKIVSKTRSGLCAKHQRALKRSIKHARYIGLLPFVVYPR